MPIEMFILGTLGFAVAGAVLYVWGYRKSRRTPQRLQAQMGKAIEDCILGFLSEKEKGATLKEIAKAIQDIQVGGQLQGYKLQVEDGQAAAGAVLQRLAAKGLIAEQRLGKLTTYVLVKGE